MHDGTGKKRYTFKRTEILRKKKLIRELFKNGSSFFIYPFKVFYLPAPELDQSQVLFSVSKKYFKRATERNLIKRRLREAYRLNKHQNLLLVSNKNYCFAIVYISKLILPFSEVQDKLIQVIQRLSNVGKY